MYISFFHLSTDVPTASGSLATKATAKQQVPAGPVSDADADLEARLENLKRQ